MRVLFLLFLSLPVVAEASCGFLISDASVKVWDKGVPLLVDRKPLSLNEPGNSGVSAPSDCPRTEAYLKKIFHRLLQASKLSGISESFPKLDLVYQCYGKNPLPAARAIFTGTLFVFPQLPRLAPTEDAIAAVLSHELAHFTLFHSARLYSEMHDAKPRNVYDIKRAHEREADMTGLKILVNAGYNPRAAIDHLELVEKIAQDRRADDLKFFTQAKHDSANSRLNLLRTQISSCSYPTQNGFTEIPRDIKEEIAQPKKKKNAVF